MILTEEDRSTRRKPLVVATFPPQITHTAEWEWIRVSAATGRSLRVWAMARPCSAVRTSGCGKLVLTHFSSQRQDSGLASLIELFFYFFFSAEHALLCKQGRSLATWLVLKTARSNRTTKWALGKLNIRIVNFNIGTEPLKIKLKQFLLLSSTLTHFLLFVFQFRRISPPPQFSPYTCVALK